MAPESIKDSGRSDPRSDIYSVGALGYYLLTGEFVFDSESVHELCEKHLKVAPPPPGRRTTNPISAPLESIILRCLEKDPALRPQSAPELRALLLASPHASEWSVEARAAWWAEYRAQAVPKPGETEHPRDGAADVSVSVDFASRIK